MSALKDGLVRWHWGPFRVLIQRLGAHRAYGLARVLAWILYAAAGGKRKAYQREYDVVAGVRGQKGRGRAVLGAFRVLLCNEFEVLLFPRMNENTIGECVEYAGLEHLDAALRRGKGAILLFAHFGANQMIMPAVGYKGYHMCQLSAPPMVWEEKLPHKTFSAWERKALELRWRHEESLPVKHINIFGSLRPAFTCLKNNHVLGVAVDGGGGAKRADVGFLGRRAALSTGAVEMAARTGSALLPTFMVRQRDGRNRMVVEQSLDTSGMGKGEDDRRRKTLQVFANRLEEYVTAHPDHYLGFLALRRFMARQGDVPFFTGETAS